MITDDDKKAAHAIILKMIYDLRHPVTEEWITPCYENVVDLTYRAFLAGILHERARVKQIADALKEKVREKFNAQR